MDAPLKMVWEVARDITLIPQYHPEVDKVDLIAGQAKRSLGTKYQRARGFEESSAECSGAPGSLSAKIARCHERD